MQNKHVSKKSKDELHEKVVQQLFVIQIDSQQHCENP